MKDANFTYRLAADDKARIQRAMRAEGIDSLSQFARKAVRLYLEGLEAKHKLPPLEAAAPTRRP